VRTPAASNSIRHFDRSGNAAASTVISTERKRAGKSFRHGASDLAPRVKDIFTSQACGLLRSI